MKIDNLTPDDMEKMLNKKSGAWGVSGVSEDYRDIEAGYVENDERSRLALDSQAYITAQYIAKYLVSLGGLDVLLFTGGVGENGQETRERICDYLGFLGLEIDKVENDVKGVEKRISTENSKVEVFIVPTNEELMIAQDTYKIVKGQM
jgi:acetate kinase